MSEAEAMSPIKRALLEIRELRARLARMEGAEAALAEPVAIIGMGLRFPGGVRDADGLADLLWSGRDAVGDIPRDRWPLDSLYDADPDAPGRMTTRKGAFLDAVDLFDAGFFGIAPREAASMDPQQRLLLEVGWEALEDAGHAPDGLAGSRTGVYLGIANSDYGRLALSRTEQLDAYAGTGAALSVAAGRIAYVLGLQGPSLAVDTACSSSLVALHLAAQGLRLRECDMALAGGINLILSPEYNIAFSKARMLAADGRCKTFDAAADGYGRAEGCGLIVLRRLSDAVAGGDRILAVLRGSAVNGDGRSGGLTAPTGPAQEGVIRDALRAAALPPHLVSYVEAHGTGTPLGDPIELNAIGAALGAGRPGERPLLVGSIKTNLGHTEAAAGIAGLMKVVLGLGRREIPPHLHVSRATPHVDWAALSLSVPTAVTPWPAIEGRRIAGVSAFGFSGCNAHVILEEAPPAPASADLSAPSEARSLHLLPLAARDDRGLRALAGRYAAALAGGPSLADVCHTAGIGRAHLPRRLAVLGDGIETMRRALGAFSAGGDDPALLAGGGGVGTPPRVAFLFTGQGAQHAGMARLLYDTAPTFREAIDACAADLDPYLPGGIAALLRADGAGETDGIDATRLAQPALFAVAYALAVLWRSWGIEPVAVLGHSFGEYAAAAVAGVLPLDDALRLVAERGLLTERHAEPGGMAAVFASEAQVAAGLGAGVAIAAVNGPAHCVVSGATAPFEAALRRYEAAGLRTHRLRVSFPAHSPAIEPVLAPLRAVLETVQFGAPRIELISNVTGEPVDAATICRPEYWVDHMRRPVQFARSVQTLTALGVTHVIEIGPHPVLLGMAAECVDGPAWLPSLHRDRADWTDLLEGLQRLYVDGAPVRWAALDRDPTRRRVALPLYPFQGQRHWLDSGPSAASSTPSERRARVAAALDRQAAQGPLDLNPGSYPAKWALAARLTDAHAVRTLHESGVFARTDETHDLDSVLAATGFRPVYRHLVGRWLDRLAAAGLLRADGAAYRAVAPLPEPDLPDLWREAEAAFADNRPLLDYIRHCGTLVGRVLRGVESPLETLFPGGSFTLAEGLYERSATMRYANALAAAAVGALSQALPERRVLRVLEIGAGSGATTAALLPVLPDARTEYRFTDVSDLFLERARTRFSGHAGFHVARFDMEDDPAAQGFAPGSLDVIVSANAVHACADLPATLRRLRGLLAPGGALVLVESTTHFDWFDMTTGLIDGWQLFADGLRTDDPLLPPDRWVSALEAAGFETAQAWPDAASAARHLGQHVLLAFAAGGIGAAAGSAARPARQAAEGAQAEASAAQTEAGPAKVSPEPADIGRAVLAALPAERLDRLREFVRAQVMHVLRRGPDDPPGLHERLMELGLDSLMAVQLRGLLAARLGLDAALPATLIFDYPTTEAVAAHLLDRLLPPAAAPGAAPPAAPPTDLVPSDAEIERLLEGLGQP